MREACMNGKCDCLCHHTNENSCHHDEEHEGSAYRLLEIGDCAWAEVLKEKIKAHILSTDNDRMTELAKIIAQGNSERWKHKMGKKRICKTFEENLCHFFEKPKK